MSLALVGQAGMNLPKQFVAEGGETPLRTDQIVSDGGRLFWKGNPVNVQLPNYIEVKVTQSDPGIKGDTSSGATKPATLESGATINVPLFIKEGDVLRVDTRTGEYSERVAQ